jgi:hypothetical protein
VWGCGLDFSGSGQCPVGGLCQPGNEHSGSIKAGNFWRLEILLRSWDSKWYSAGLRAGWSVVRVPAGTGNFSLHHRVHTGSGAHPASYPMGNRGSFPGEGVKRLEHEADHSPPSSSKVKNEWSYTSTPQYGLLAWCSVSDRSNFTFTFTIPELLLASQGAQYS